MFFEALFMIEDSVDRLIDKFCKIITCEPEKKEYKQRLELLKKLTMMILINEKEAIK